MKRWLMKTVGTDGEAHGGFVWPLEIGAEVGCPDWSDDAICGGGLHGLLDGQGEDYHLSWESDARWIVAEIPIDAKVVDLDGKVKVDRCVIAHVGDRVSAPAFLAEQGVVGPIVATTATAGDQGTATAGYQGTATAGYQGTATAGYQGCITILYWDGTDYRRRCAEVDGTTIRAGVAYRLDADGNFVEAEVAS